jgi:formylglycine-generating enzyme required for sulfatase activity
LLRAGLVPLLRDHQVSVVYLPCRIGTTTSDELAEALGGVTRNRDRPAWRTVIILDQLETALMGAPGVTCELVTTALDATRRHGAAEVAVVLCVREEFLARLFEQTQSIEPSLPVLRLGPLTPAAARQVIELSVATRRLVIEPDLLDILVTDLERAGAGLAAQLGWGDAPAVYPPHLQLAGAMLCEALADDRATLDLGLYRRLGGLAHILGEHLHRVLEVELTPERTAIARDVLLGLVTSAQLRAARSEAELVAMARQSGASTESPRTAAAVVEVISFLRDRGLLVSVVGSRRETIWELAHDSLVPRIQAWITATDLARRRALELVRYHLRRSQPGVPSLLAPGELTEIARCTTLRDLDELDAEWAGSEATVAHPATTLLRLSRRALRARRSMVGTAVVITAAVVIVLIARWQSERHQREREAALRDRDTGRFTLELSAFDWDPQRQTAADVPLRELPELVWTLYKPDAADSDAPGVLYPAADLDRRILPPPSPMGSVAAVAARGGPAVLVIRGRGRRRFDGSIEPCGDSIVPIRRLPGYSEPGSPPAYRVRVPTCDATRTDTIEIPAGRFIAGGLGDPAASFAPGDLPAEVEIDMAAFRIDRTEVTNGAFAIFAAFDVLHGVPMIDYPPSAELRAAQGPAYPVSFVTWVEARAYCRYLGKDLPTLDQWDKALRGGLTVRGAPNPSPRRTFAWAGGFVPGSAAVPDVPAHRRPFPVGSFPIDTSPDGVVDLSGNVMEWTLAVPPRTGTDDPRLRDELARAADLAPRGRFRTIRGCGWDETLCVGGQNLVNASALPNMRAHDLRNFMLGFRCALTTRQ